MRGKDVRDSAPFPPHEGLALVFPVSFVLTFAVPFSNASTKVVLEFRRAATVL